MQGDIRRVEMEAKMRLDIALTELAKHQSIADKRYNELAKARKESDATHEKTRNDLQQQINKLNSKSVDMDAITAMKQYYDNTNALLSYGTLCEIVQDSIIDTIYADERKRFFGDTADDDEEKKDEWKCYKSFHRLRLDTTVYKRGAKQLSTSESVAFEMIEEKLAESKCQITKLSALSRVIGTIKKARNPVAHPPIDIDTLRVLARTIQDPTVRAEALKLLAVGSKLTDPVMANIRVDSSAAQDTATANMLATATGPTVTPVPTV